MCACVCSQQDGVQSQRRKARDDVVDAVAAVDHDGFPARFVAGNRAVTRQRPHRKRFENHDDVRAFAGRLIHVDPKIVIAPVEISQRRAAAGAARDDVPDEDRMRTDVMFAGDFTVEMGDRAG